MCLANRPTNRLPHIPAMYACRWSNSAFCLRIYTQTAEVAGPAAPAGSFSGMSLPLFSLASGSEMSCLPSKRTGLLHAPLTRHEVHTPSEDHSHLKVPQSMKEQRECRSCHHSKAKGPWPFLGLAQLPGKFSLSTSIKFLTPSCVKRAGTPNFYTLHSLSWKLEAGVKTKL